MEIKFSEEIVEKLPELRVLLITADVSNPPTSDELWAEIIQYGKEFQETYKLEDINKRPGIAGTREAYKMLGKEPNRYRPSTEAMCRRFVKGYELYRSLALIDLINLLSLKSGYSIGGFDSDKIEGDVLTLGVGEEGEPYEAIGRGLLNIAHLPVFRDSVGGVGTPTSDNDRTKLSADTKHLAATINIYREEMSIEDTLALATRLLTDYGLATNIQAKVYSVSE